MTYYTALKRSNQISNDYYDKHTENYRLQTKPKRFDGENCKKKADFRGCSLRSHIIFTTGMGAWVASTHGVGGRLCFKTLCWERCRASEGKRARRAAWAVDGRPRRMVWLAQDRAAYQRFVYRAAHARNSGTAAWL